MSHYGFINSKGALIIPAIYFAAKPFRYGVADVCTMDGKQICLDRTGKRLTPSEATISQDFKRSKENVRSEMTYVQTIFPTEMNGEWGYVNAAGDVIIKPQFKRAHAFSEGLAAVEI